MAKQVKAFGQVLQFPDEMSDDDMAKAILDNEHVLNPNWKQPKPDPEALDYAKGFASGANKLVSGIGYLAEKAGAEKFGKATRELGDRGADYWNKQMSAGGKRIAGEQVFVDDPESSLGIRLHDEWGKALMMGASQSLPSMFAAAIPGGLAAKGMQKLASLGLAGGAGATIPLLAGTASPVGVASNVIARVPSAVGFGAAEGLITAGTGAAELKSSMEEMPESERDKSPVYKALSSIHGKEKAWQLITDQAASDLFGKTALSTGAIGALTGGGALGQAYQKATVGAGDGILKTVLKSGTSEFVQETPQSGAEKYIENTTKQKYLDPSIQSSDGVLSSALTGGTVGAFMGGIVGGGSSVNLTPDRRAQILKEKDKLAKEHAEAVNRRNAQQDSETILNAGSVDEAIKAANESTSRKPVTKDDILRTVDPTLADIERLTGLKPSESIDQAISQAQQGLNSESIPAQGQQDNIAPGVDMSGQILQPKQGNIYEEESSQQATRPTQNTGVLGSNTEIVLPDNTTLPARWEIIDSDSIKATIKEGVNQPRDRTRSASDLQIQGIANNPDYRRLSDSPVLDIGAPVISHDGMIVAGNGRFEGLSQAHSQGSANAYLEALKNDAVNKGIDPSVISGMTKPVLVRRITQPYDTRKLAIDSNSGTSLQYSGMELAKIDAERMAGIEDLDITDTGDIALTGSNIDKLKQSLGGYNATELASLVDKNGVLSQDGVRRVRNSLLAKAYGGSDTLGRLIESTDNDARNVLGALTRSAGVVAKVRSDIKQGAIPKDSDVTDNLLNAVETFAQIRSKGQPLEQYLAQENLFGDTIDADSKEILQFLHDNIRSQKKLTAFIKDIYGQIANIDQSTEDIFGDNTVPSKQDVIQNAKQRTEGQAVEQQDIFESGKKPAQPDAKQPKTKTDYAGSVTESQQDTELKPRTPEERLKDHERSRQLERSLRGQGYDFSIETRDVRILFAENGRSQEAATAERIAGMFGKRVVWIETIGGFRINGVISSGIKDTIFIDIRTEHYAHAIMGHELSHHMEIEAPEAYRDMVNALMPMIKEVETYRKIKSLGKSTSSDDVIKEIVGDIMGDNFLDQAFWDKVAEANPSAFKRIADTVIAWLKKLVTNAKMRGLGSERWVTDAKKAQDIIAKAVAQYTGENATGNEGGVEFSRASQGSLFGNNNNLVSQEDLLKQNSARPGDLFSGNSKPEKEITPTKEEKTASGIEWRQVITNIMSKDVFRDTVSESIQNDGQKVLDAAAKMDVATLKAINIRYAKEAGLNQGGGGAGPGKVNQPRRGAEPVYNASLIALQNIEKTQASDLFRDNPDAVVDTKSAGKIDDFGEKLGGARKDMERSITKEYTDDDIATQPLSKIWPKDDYLNIEEPFLAAFYFTAREEVPTKPRVSYRIPAWVQKVKQFRGLMQFAVAKNITEQRVIEFSKNYPGLEQFFNKMQVLAMVPDRKDWGRVESVAIYPDAYKYDDNGVKISSPYASIKIDGRTTLTNVTNIEQVANVAKEKLGNDAPEKLMQFEIRGRTGDFFINKKGDKEYRVLKRFTDLKEARAYWKDNYDDLVAAWESVKESDNVRKSDIRSEENRPRTGRDWRKSSDITPKQFQEAFGFRGVEFGNWVSQGAGNRDRQGMLNQTYDALMDLSSIVGIPPKAISLEGSLGLGFGSRGKGAALAHFEPGNLVINLTKTKGAGNLAHEWFHALDNYFQRKRGEGKSLFITYYPERMMVHKEGKWPGKYTKATLSKRFEMTGNKNYNPDMWMLDPAHPLGVRPEIEAKFSDLVQVLDDSPMKQRAEIIDKGKADGYWSRIIERAARSFENYVIAKMMKAGYNNDYLANVTNVTDFRRDTGRYPYLLESEIAPVEDAFDNLFAEIKTRETEKGIAMFSRVSKEIPETINIDGIDRPTRNSEGKLIHPTEEGIRNFYEWFKNSKVVDDQGRPQVKYKAMHPYDWTKETANDPGPLINVIKRTTPFPAFNDGEDGVDIAGFFGDRETANKFTVGSKSSAVYPVYLSLENIFILDAKGELAGKTQFGKDGAEFRSAVRSGDYDGVVILNTKDEGDLYVTLNPNQSKSAIGNNGQFSSDNDDIRFSKAGKQKQEEQLVPESKFRKFQRLWQDDFNRFVAIKEWLAERGINLSEQADVSRAEERYHSKVANQIEDFRDFVRNPLIEKIAKAGFAMSDIADYLEAQHAREANDAMQKLHKDPDITAYGITNDEADDYLSKAPKELGVLANEFRDITEQSKKLLLDNGLRSQEEIDAWESAYKHYIPVKGSDKPAKGTGKGLSVHSKTKRRLGHGRRDEAVIENILLDHERAIMEVEKNRVAKHLGMMAAEIAMPELMTIGQPVKRRVLKSTVAYEVQVKGITRAVFDSKEGANTFKQMLPAADKKIAPREITINPTRDQRVISSASPMLAENEINMYIDGHAIRIQINDEIAARAYKHLGIEGYGHMVAAGRAINGYLSKIYTGYAPEWGISNIIRDFTTGIINLTGEEGIRMTAKAVKNYPGSFASLLRYAFTDRKKSTKWIDMYRANGGNTGAAYLSDMERLGNDVASEYASFQGVIANIKQGDMANASRAALRKLHNVFLKWLNNLNQASENAMRLAAFKAMIKSGKSINESAHIAKNVTINFNKKGEFGQSANSAYLFFNATMNGQSAINHALFKGKHKYQAWALGGAGLTALGYTMAAMLGGGDEDEYDKIDDYTKERNMMVNSGDGWVKIPVPYGHGFFWNLGRAIADAQRKDEMGVLPWHVAASAIEELTPFGGIVVGSDEEFKADQVFLGLMPTVAQIAGQPALNKSIFSGGEIMPESQFDQSQPDRDKMWRGTKGTMYDKVSGWFKEAGMDVSPETLKHLTRSLTGGAGSTVDTVISSALLKKEGAELDTNEVPFVRKVYHENTIRNDRAAFQKARKEAKTAAEEFRRANRDNDLVAIDKILKDKHEMLMLDNYANKLQKFINMERDEQDAVRTNESIPIAERRLKLKELEAKEASFYDEYLDVFKIDKAVMKERAK